MSRAAIPFVGAFESTYQPAHDRDVVETTQHDLRWRSDLELLQSAGVELVRYPVRWHRIEPEQGRFDWAHTDEVLGTMHDQGQRPIVDLLHHTSYPRWVGDLSAPGFGPAFLRFVEAVAERYPWLPGYTVCNEPFTTFLLCGQMGLWEPHLRGTEGFVQLATNVFPWLVDASLALRDLLPEGQHVHVEASEHHTSAGPEGDEFTALANDRRFLLTDLLVGHEVDADRPFARELLAAGGERLLTTRPGHVDVLGIDYYAHNQWHWSAPGRGTNVAPAPIPLAELIRQYWDRYGLPTILGETNISGFASDRVSWLKHTLEQCEIARDGGVDMRGYCWFPSIDSADWASNLVRCEGNIDPVGVWWLDEHLDRRTSSMSRAYAAAAGGAPSSSLPAYQFRPPVSAWVQGWLPHMAHWDWQEPPYGETCSSKHAPDTLMGLITDVA